MIRREISIVLKAENYKKKVPSLNSSRIRYIGSILLSARTITGLGVLFKLDFTGTRERERESFDKRIEEEVNEQNVREQYSTILRSS